MCVSLAPASFFGTIVYGGEVSGLGVHVLGYQNSVQNRQPLLSTLWSRWEGRPTGNAMLLHFPAAEPMTEANMIDTTHCPHILQDMAQAVMPPPPPTMWRGERMVSLGADRPDVIVFTRGIYDVVLARDARYVADALEQVRPDKRPPITDAIFQAYSDWFPEWPVALCCFNNRQLKRAEPLLWWYRPRNTSLLFAPALDAHTGAPPSLVEPVDVDHTVIFGSDRLETGSRVRFRDRLAEPEGYYPTSAASREWIIQRASPSNLEHRLAEFERGVRERQVVCDGQSKVWPYVPKQVHGGPVKGRLPNGDFACQVSTLLGSQPAFDRLPPRELAGLVT